MTSSGDPLGKWLQERKLEKLYLYLKEQGITLEDFEDLTWEVIDDMKTKTGLIFQWNKLATLLKISKPETPPAPANAIVIENVSQLKVENMLV